jgi:2,4-dienoyl-CoA reductase-like NADH-dependent reductase (Old Yellow Enzyme family)
MLDQGDSEGTKYHAMSEVQLLELIEGFAQAARRAKDDRWRCSFENRL